MSKKKKPLSVRLELMADDIQIGGDINYRAMGVAVVLDEATKTLTEEARKDMERLLSRGYRLLGDLAGFWKRHPELDLLGEPYELAYGKRDTT